MKKITISKHPLGLDYYLTKDGRVWSGKYHRPLSTALDKDGYVKVTLVSPGKKRHRYSVHRLMMENYRPIKDMDKMQVNHIDGNKQNNHLSNLEWCTCKENIHHAMKNNLRHDQKGENNNGSKYTEKQILEAIEMIKSKKYTGKEIDEKMGFCSDYANMIRRKERWAHLTKDIVFDQDVQRLGESRRV